MQFLAICGLVFLIWYFRRLFGTLLQCAALLFIAGFVLIHIGG